jgi:hypothetical protein
METINHIEKIIPAHTMTVEVPEKKIVKTIVIQPDRDAESPREWDNLGTMYCWHRDYTLGDEQPKCDPNQQKINMICEYDPGFEQWLDKKWANYLADSREEENRWYQSTLDEHFDKYYISLPLYLMDHSGLSMSTGGYSCPWDSGQVGFIAISREKVRNEYSCKRVSEQRKQQVLKYLTGEVETYSQYLEGAVYGFTIYEHDIYDEPDEGESTDSCWGFYGHDPKENGMNDHLPDGWETTHGLAYDFGYDGRHDYDWRVKHEA